jgi:hypothetical protein
MTPRLEDDHVDIWPDPADNRVVTDTGPPTRNGSSKESIMSISTLSAKLANRLEQAREERQLVRALQEAPTPASRAELELLARLR